MDFYQSMTTQGSQSPTAIHFSIDGRQGILEAKHIAKALHIPYKPVDPAHFREWSPISQRDMDELPTESVPHAPATPPVPEATSTDPSTTPHVPLAASLTSEASITISATEYRAMTNIPGLSEPIALAEETTKVDVPLQATHKAAIEPSSPLESVAT
ncbi:hypothetical protein CK203_107280 [Vitis vinifera]|uniref:Uncharacterized protein n=1 Tax=Vitis vinifera TaxID=29760 RepID=A0A438DLB5_VITVI|nr:hypothetical protein CK203_107280 [Vitis vinifera]